MFSVNKEVFYKFQPTLFLFLCSVVAECLLCGNGCFHCYSYPLSLFSFFFCSNLVILFLFSLFLLSFFCLLFFLFPFILSKVSTIFLQLYFFFNSNFSWRCRIISLSMSLKTVCPCWKRTDINVKSTFSESFLFPERNNMTWSTEVLTYFTLRSTHVDKTCHFKMRKTFFILLFIFDNLPIEVRIHLDALFHTSWR